MTRLPLMLRVVGFVTLPYFALQIAPGFLQARDIAEPNLGQYHEINELDGVWMRKSSDLACDAPQNVLFRFGADITLNLSGQKRVMATNARYFENGDKLVVEYAMRQKDSSKHYRILYQLSESELQAIGVWSATNEGAWRKGDTSEKNSAFFSYTKCGA